MAANEQIDAFLKGGAPEAAETPASEPAADSAAAAPEAPAPAVTPAPATAEDDTDPPEPREGEPIIPRSAYEAERKRRQDWKEKAARAEGELAELRRQMEEARRPQPAPAQQPQYQQRPMPDPNTDLQGYLVALEQRNEARALNMQLNTSEMFLREKIGPEKVNEYVSEFKRAAEADPSLYGKLYSQPNPYGWMQREVERMRLMNEVSDPDAYRAKVRAELEAELRAALPVQQQPPVSPAAGQPRSLATARSVAPRSAPQWSGERPLDQILADRRR